ncbi:MULTISPECIES: Eco57I restriction-modification methylase domain-containing protein [Bacteroidales]|nr:MULTISPECIES: DNA methyltransferase [Bacteroidales]ROT04480.1 SAM-dependent methyltransferase [Muribaculaceae bacterium Isolate-100 (HZI)]RXE64242.1 SAM-dependent methyltransferase [Muribaculaceae bacterium Isolate-007 (NCI)]TGX79808.1 SAM-dependent methyltransferase [Muribaculum intestinale]
MIKKPQFLNLIRQGDFKELFVTELGWNRYRGHAQLPPIFVDDKEYNITAIAERSGFQILYSGVDEIPTQSMAKKIDTKLRRQALDYICIYRLRGTAHDLWVVPVRTNEKRDLVLVEYDNANAEVVFQKIDGITFDFDEQTNIVDLRSKVQTAFAVNSEKITKDFYAGFKKQHKAFAEFITGIDDYVDTKNNRNKQWYASVMLNRLMFCYFIQKKGFLNLDVDYLRNKLNYVRTNEGNDKFYNFYRSFLRSLFHDGLNTPKHSRDFEAVFGKIPYLNGGMFDEHQLEADYDDIDIPDEAFIGLFDFFDKWNWHLDTRLTASGKDINPDVLGYIFEQYINDRAQMGAYYTKEDITEYIGRNCILPYLFDQVRTATKESAKEFAPDGYVWRTLRESGDRYIFDAVKKGYNDFDKVPESIARGIITDDMRKEYSETPVGELPDSHIPLAELRSEWNARTPEQWGLPNEIWRESIDRMQRCDSILGKINRGEITSINDFITYNLDIRTFASDLIANGDSRFVGWFYHALQKVTILDPTCGSGAFLFAAMNILEPLYEICIDRMQEFNRQNPAKFKEELAEITDKYRSNIQYFIFKSIILRNLYGVDIMVEATEIAKLRLFLKMVAVVDVERRAENLGLDPLPDIDFNIRCGNTLVGYATKAQLDNDLSHPKDFLEELANQDFKQQIEDEVLKVAAAYRIFVYQQLRQEEDMMAFKQAKHDLRELLKSLNDKLNHRLYSATSPNISYDEWLKSHQPFNWLAEFYQIIEGNGGFDVIIGNPPYVEYSKRNVNYQISGFETIKASNLYAYVFERSFCIGKDYIGFIVQLSAIGTESMRPLQRYLRNNSGTLHYGCYPERPQQLFEGACIALSILIVNKKGDGKIYGSGVNRVSEGFRDYLFGQIAFIKINNSDFLSDYSLYPKFRRQLERGVFKKLAVDSTISNYLGTDRNNAITYRTAGGRYWKIVINRPFANMSTSNKTKPLNNSISSFELVSVLNTNLFWWYYVNFFDLYNFKDYMIFHFMYKSDENIESKELTRLGKLLMKSYERNKVENTQFIQSRQQTTIFESFNPAQSKSIIDEIDAVLARHYGFTDEELDFIINYDIKYRMGDELNNSDE